MTGKDALRCRCAQGGEDFGLGEDPSTLGTFVAERGGEILGACRLSQRSGEAVLEFAGRVPKAHARNLLLERGEAKAREAEAAGISVALPSSSRALCRDMQMRGYFPGSERDGRLAHRRQLAPLMDERIVYRHFDEVPWLNWPGKNPATLLFVVSRGRILLIEKKRGHGAGMVNGPGGKLEGGETAVQCAVREVEEETGVHPVGARLVGELHFQYTNGDTVFGYAFRADAYNGALIETQEAKPFWVALDEIPFDAMWDDDRVWLPLLLENRAFIGRFLVHEERLYQHEIVPRR